MPNRSLPSFQEVQTAPDPSSVLLNILAFGTDYEIWPKAEDTLEARAKEASAVLVQCWQSAPGLQAHLVDSIWLAACVATGASMTALRSILENLLAIPDRPGFLRDLQATLDPALLGQLDLIADKDAMLKKTRMLNTENNYKQQKFNLLQEESEGYAKVFSFLWRDDPSDRHIITLIHDDNDDHSNSNLIKLHRLIGKFKLDPIRVLDIMLDCLEQGTKSNNFDRQQQLLNLIRDILLKNQILPLIHFKILNYERRKEPLPSTLYSMISLLAQEKLIDLKLLVPAGLAHISSAHDIFTKLYKKKLSKMVTVSLGGAKEPDESMTELSKQLDAAVASLETSNVLIGLLKVLLENQRWDLCSSLLTTHEEWTQVCTLMPGSIGNVLSNVVGEHFKLMYCYLVKTPVLNKEVPTKPAPYALPETATLDQLIISCSTPLQALAGSYCLQPALYAQMCRLTRALLLKENQNAILKPTTFEFLNSFLVSSLSLLPPNPALSVELWRVLDILPFTVRYKLYHSWSWPGLERAGMGFKPLALVQAEMMAGKEARHCLKRLSLDNIRDMGHQVSKVTHSNPLVVFMTILNQIESYDNLIQMMVEIVRFVTPLSMDVLGYCILTRLRGSVAGANRNKLKDDGVNVSQWLSSLESFTGAFYKKCPDVEFRGIFLYLIHQLKNGQVLELGVLRTLITDAGGYSFADYSSASSLPMAQLAGRAGSQLLKRETYAFGIVEHVNTIASNRIRSVLQSDNLGITILILLAQMRSKLIFDKGGAGKTQHVKLIGNLYDSCQVVTSILLEFLTSDDFVIEDDHNRSESALAKYASSMPSLKSLLLDYAMDAPSAWMLYRPVIQLDYRSRKASNGKSAIKIKENYVERTEVIKSVLPTSIQKDLTPSLVDFFFSYSLYDVYLPEESYTSSISRLKRVEDALVHKQRIASSESDKHFTRDDEMELGRIRRVATRLPDDMNAQASRFGSCVGKLQNQGSGLFPSETVSTASVQAFFTYCIFPRCTFGPEDAMYCAHFALLLHANNTPGFSFMHFVDELMNVVECSLYSSTEGEAASIAILLLETWKVISRWRYNKESFEIEVAGKPGSFMVHDGEGTAPVSYPKFKILYNRWHATMGKAFLGCLHSKEYIHLRACFLVLNRIVDEFPTRPVLGQRLLDAMGPMLDEAYPLQDISAAAQSYSVLLSQARSSGVWKEEDASAAKARENDEKAAQLQRKKKAEEQLAEMEIETKAIDKELGDDQRGRRDGGRRDGRGPPRDDRRLPFVATSSDTRARDVKKERDISGKNATATSSDPRSRDDQKERDVRLINSNPPSFEPRPRDDQKDRVVRGREGDQGDRRGGDGSRTTPKDQVNDLPSKGRDERGHPNSFSRVPDRVASASNRGDGLQRGNGPRHAKTDEAQSGLEGRWERGGRGGGTQHAKRDHSPGIDDPNKRRRTDDQEEQPQSQPVPQFTIGRSDPQVRGRGSGARPNDRGPGGYRRVEGRRP